MAPRSNKGVIFVKTPENPGPPPLSTFKTEHREIDIEKYELNSGDVLLRNLYLSVDPYIIGRIRQVSGQFYFFEPFKLGQVVESGGIAEVVKSNDERYAVGDVVTAIIGRSL